MATQVINIPLMHVYHLTYDGVDTGYTIEQVVQLKEQYGWDYRLDVTVTTPDNPEEPPAEEPPV